MPPRTLILAGALALGMLPGASFAQTPQDAIIAQLEALGYRITSIETTWLGRVRIEAENATHERELVFNPKTGVVLRDYWEPHDDEDDDGRNGSDDEDDDEDEDDDD